MTAKGNVMGDHWQTHEDNKHVALIKSLATNNRFYAWVPRDSHISNADVVAEVPHDLLLGIVYSCIEDALNDFAIIHTTFETLDLFPDDEELRAELMEMINDARTVLAQRLMELLERFVARKAFFLGTDLEDLKTLALNMMHRGFPRRNLDSIMKVNIFSTVAAVDTATDQSPADARTYYRYAFHNRETQARLSQLPGRDFLVSLFADVLDSVLDSRNYESQFTFDKHIFQQYIALMFLVHSSMDTVFHGVHKDDYGVSKDKDMDNTPLYVAVAHELREIALSSVAVSREGSAMEHEANSA